jgi:PadR family transcriptional regulator PadR
MAAQSQLLKGVLPLAALTLVSRADTYGYEVAQQLREAGLTSVGDASVYGTLQRLHEDGSVSAYLVASEAGPARRYFALTEAGAHVLEQGRKEWTAFADTVSALLGRPGGSS